MPPDLADGNHGGVLDDLVGGFNFGAACAGLDQARLQLLNFLRRTALGGFLAESTTDLIQGIIMSFSLGFVFIYGVIHAGGFGNVIENASKLPGYLSVSASYVWETGGSRPYTALAAICLLVKFFTEGKARGQAKAWLGAIVGTAFGVACSLAAGLISAA